MSVSLLQARTDAQPGRAVVFLVGELDLHTAPRVGNAVAACLAERPESLCVDLTEVVFCDCAGLNALLEARLDAREAGVELYVEGIGPQVARLFELSGADKVLVEGMDGITLHRIAGGTVRESSGPPPHPLS